MPAFLRWSQFGTCQLVAGLVVALHLLPAAGAEYLFNDNIRINKGFQPRLTLQQGVNANAWSIVNTNGQFGVLDADDNMRFQLSGSAMTKIYVAHDGPFTIADDGDATLRLYTYNGMWPDYKWELNGNFQSFTLADASADTLPFQVAAGAPNDRLYLNKHVGVGTTSPEYILATIPNGESTHLNLKTGTGTARQIVQGDAGAESYLVHAGGSAGRKVVRTRVAGGKYLISTMSDDLASNTEVPFSIDLSSKNVGIKTSSPAKPFQVGDAGANDGNGAHVTAGGVWTNASSRSVKDDIQPVSLDMARDTIRALQPVTYRYKNETDEQYVGFIAEDVPELVATQDRKSLAAMDITAVLTRVVQDQDRQLDEQRTTIAKLERTNTEQQSQISEQQALLAALNKRLTDLERTCGDRTEQTQSSASP